MELHQRDDRWPEWMRPGVRVVRGPDLLPTVRDAVAVELGTLTYVPSRVADNKVCVIWDSGREKYYKSGATGYYELRAYDLQQVGIVHKGTSCADCGARPIRGIRFHCPKPKLDLCTACYMADWKGVDNAFIRMDTPNSDGELLPLRSASKHTWPQLRGMFKNATVVPGPHWNYAENREVTSITDEGTVLRIVSEKDGVRNGWVEVQWTVSGKTGVYRAGAGGYVDVVAAVLVVEGHVYLEHLPVIGIIKLKVGDKVCINLTLADFKALQCKVLDDIGWTEAMNQCLKRVGTILELSPDGKLARVQYADGSKFLIGQEALYRKASFYTGCAVSIIKDKNALEEIQQGHGQYCPEICGKLGRVLNIRRDGDMKVLIGQKSYGLSPTCCEPVEDAKVAKKAPDMPEEDDEEEETVFEDKMKSMYDALSRSSVSLDALGMQMFNALKVGDIKAVKNLIEKNTQLVKYKTDQGTVLHLVSYEGHTELLSFLIKLGGDIHEKDKEGDTPLHNTAHGQQSACAQTLLKAGADPNCQNNAGQTPLVAAIVNASIDTVQILVQNKAKVNIKANDGSTAMHDAVEQTKGQPVISACVLGASSADFTICNASNFNVLNWAIMKNNVKAVEIVLTKSSRLVASKMLPEEYSPLHITATNNFVDIAGVLLEKGKADVDARDKHKMTPLHLAALQGHKGVIELLIDKKADVGAQDEDGNTPLHLAQMTAVSNLSITASTMTNAHTKIKITYILLEKGADLNKKNTHKKTPLDLVDDAETKAIITAMALKYQKDPMTTSVKGVKCPMYWSPHNDIHTTKMVTLDVSKTTEKSEFDDVSANFRKTIPVCHIDSIQRVQSPLLWEHYCLKKLEMEGRLGKGRANEVHLFHGTKSDLVDLIAKENFDFRLSGSNVGALYGQGAYFATTAKYSDSYAGWDVSGHKYMFVVKVLAGKPYQGKSGLRKPPPIDDKDPKKGSYNCTVDNVANPRIYCIFDVNQYYPEYVVKYQS